MDSPVPFMHHGPRDPHPRRPRGKIIGREEDKTAVSVGAKVYFSFHTTKVNFRADRNRRFIRTLGQYYEPDNLDGLL